jgi:hypothetical protein
MREMDCGPRPAGGSISQLLRQKLGKGGVLRLGILWKTGIPEAQIAFLLASGKKVLFLWK